MTPEQAGRSASRPSLRCSRVAQDRGPSDDALPEYAFQLVGAPRRVLLIEQVLHIPPCDVIGGWHVASYGAATVARAGGGPDSGWSCRPNMSPRTRRMPPFTLSQVKNPGANATVPRYHLVPGAAYLHVHSLKDGHDQDGAGLQARQPWSPRGAGRGQLAASSQSLPLLMVSRLIMLGRRPRRDDTKHSIVVTAFTAIWSTTG